MAPKNRRGPELVDPGYGDPLAPVGSPEWAKRWRLCFQNVVKNLPKTPKTNLEFYNQGNEHRAWAMLTDEHGAPFADFEAFCLYRQPYGLGMAPDEFRAYLAPELARSGQTLSVAQIRADGGTQPRARLDEDHVARCVEALELGRALPPVVVFFDGTDYWLADGFHRVEAHRRAGREEIGAEVRQGTRRDAVLHSVGANDGHGLPRSPADKRRAVETLLRDEEWGGWTDREIARRCLVSHTFVAGVRRELSLATVASEPNATPQPRTYTTKHGTAAKMNTGNIGRKPAKGENGQEQPRGPAPAAQTVESPPLSREEAAALLEVEVEDVVKGELILKQASQEVIDNVRRGRMTLDEALETITEPAPAEEAPPFRMWEDLERVGDYLLAHWRKWPDEPRAHFWRLVRNMLDSLEVEHGEGGATPAEAAPPPRRTPPEKITPTQVRDATYGMLRLKILDVEARNCKPAERAEALVAFVGQLVEAAASARLSLAGTFGYDPLPHPTEQVPAAVANRALGLVDQIQEELRKRPAEMATSFIQERAAQLGLLLRGKAPAASAPA